MPDAAGPGRRRALPASRLAAEAGITPATASSHLGKLLAAGLLVVEQHGRHRYYALAGAHIGQLLELLIGLSPAQPVRSLRHGTRARALQEARTCYDHLAGRLGVAVMARMLDAGSWPATTAGTTPTAAAPTGASATATAATSTTGSPAADTPCWTTSG